MDAILDRIKAGGQIQKWTAKFANRDDASGTAPEWSHERPVTLLVNLRKNALKGHPVGELLSLNVEEFSWAEYGESDYCGNGQFLAEEYRMQLVEAQ